MSHEPQPTTTPAQAPPRTLADDLRGRDDDALAALLRARPDLLSPVPGDLTQLATRAGTRASVVRAVERLDRFALQVAEALAIGPDPCPYETLHALLTGFDAPPEATATLDVRLPIALRTLRACAMLWGDDDRLRLVRTARTVLAPAPPGISPTGLGPTLAEATAGMSPNRLQEILAANDLPGTHDPVSALASLTELFTDRPRMTALLAESVPPESRDVLERLVWGPPYGSVGHRPPSPPVARLLDRGLLLPAVGRTVLLPREVALYLRGGRTHRVLEPVPPQIVPQHEHSARTVDATAAGQAFAALATVEELCGCWETDPPTVLRAGGVGVRDLKRTAVALDLPEPTAAFWIELALAAGLLASDGEVDEVYAPTPAYDDWLDTTPEERWGRLAAAWLAQTRVPGLVGERDAKGRALAALGPGLDRGLAPDVRHRVLTLLAGLTPGAAPEPESVSARLAWERPLRGAGVPAGRARGRAAAPGHGGSSRGPVDPAEPSPDLRTRLVRWTLAEAELLGLTGRGALATYARALVPTEDTVHGAPADTPSHDAAATPCGSTVAAAPGRPPRDAGNADTTMGPDGYAAAFPRVDAPTWGRVFTTPELATAVEKAAAELAPLLPEPLDHVLLQADLTAIAPGPLERELGVELSMLAEVESKGGATVYRFTPSSVRRGLDAGRSASEIHALLAAHSRTPVPQPLSYLVDDVARRHGRLRVGAAGSYVRCDDDALLAEILADKRSAPMRLLAPTVAASPLPPDQLLGRLRDMGYAPAAESAEGDVLVARPDAHRTPPRTAPAPFPDGPPVPDTALLTAAVRAIRAGDHAATATYKPKIPAAARARDGEPPRTGSADTIATMQSAVLTGAALWIGYVNADGAASRRVVAPVRVEGGFVTAYDHTADEVRTYPLHRITGVAELAEE